MSHVRPRPAWLWAVQPQASSSMVLAQNQKPKPKPTQKPTQMKPKPTHMKPKPSQAPVEHKDKEQRWISLLQKSWENEKKTSALEESALSESSGRHPHDSYDKTSVASDDKYKSDHEELIKRTPYSPYLQWHHRKDESIRKEKEDSNEAMIRRTIEVLNRHRQHCRGEAVQVQVVHRTQKRGRSPQPHKPSYESYPRPKKTRRGGRRGKASKNEYNDEHADNEIEMTISNTKDVLRRHRAVPGSPLPQRRSGKASSKHAKSKYADLDDKMVALKVDVQELRYSQLSCGQKFQCGRRVMKLVNDLLARKVSLSAPFLQLTVFETTDERTNETILRCIDNRRLYALKQFAKKSGQDPVMVNIKLFSQETLMQVQQYQQFIQNCDDTNGDAVRLGGQGKRSADHKQKRFSSYW